MIFPSPSEMYEFYINKTNYFDYELKTLGGFKRKTNQSRRKYKKQNTKRKSRFHKKRTKRFYSSR